MATRKNTTFQKRQKELVRKDKQKRKAERRAERKLSQSDSVNEPSEDNDSAVDTERETIVQDRWDVGVQS